MDRAVPAGIPTGHARLDMELPGGGWPRGALMEIVHDGSGLGEVSLLLGALGAVAQEGRAIAWINPPHLPYAPALASAGVPLDACLVVRPASAEDALWSADQALRSGACGAALFWLPEKTDYAWLRRLQMAAESGRTLAVLFRPTSALALATPAHLRVLVSSHGAQLLVSLPKRRGPPLARPIPVRLSGRPALRTTARPAREGETPAPVTLVADAIARHASRVPA
jgi:cell division inhibitor SulA/protein ImuA